MENVIKGQKAAIWKDLKAGKTINPLMAIYTYGCIKASSRIGELEKEKNVFIKRKRLKVKTKFGQTTIMTYSL